MRFISSLGCENLLVVTLLCRKQSLVLCHFLMKVSLLMLNGARGFFMRLRFERPHLFLEKKKGKRKEELCDIGRW